MKALLDTSISIAAMLPDHMHHADALLNASDFQRIWPQVRRASCHRNTAAAVVNPQPASPTRFARKSAP